jgi:hypothetical protein
MPDASTDSLARLRIAAEPYKSFPDAVAAVVRAMFEKGASKVTIHSSNGNRMLAIQCDVEWYNSDGLFPTILSPNLEDRPAWALAFAHHCEAFLPESHCFSFVNLGTCEGVDPQDRSTTRLQLELPGLLEPKEAYHTFILDMDGREHRLITSLLTRTIDGLRVMT